MTDLDDATGDRMTFTVPTDVPDRHTTAQLPEGERAAGTICLRLFDPNGRLTVHAHREPVDGDGVMNIPLPDDAAPGTWTLMRGVLLRSMFLLPKAPR